MIILSTRGCYRYSITGSRNIYINTSDGLVVQPLSLKNQREGRGFLVVILEADTCVSICRSDDQRCAEEE